MIIIIIRWVINLHGVKQKIFRAIYPRIARRSLTACETILITLLLHHLLSLLLTCTHAYIIDIYWPRHDHCSVKSYDTRCFVFLQLLLNGVGGVRGHFPDPSNYYQMKWFFMQFGKNWTRSTNCTRSRSCNSVNSFNLFQIALKII